MSDSALRSQLARLLEWEDAHAGFDQVVEGVPADAWGRAAPGLPYTLWQLLEHLRLVQHDILDFCRNPGYRELTWPDDYWPREPGPTGNDGWRQSVAEFRRDREALAALANDRSIDLFARIPHGSGQTYLRELLLVADHSAYHLGQMVTVRRALGAWD